MNMSKHFRKRVKDKVADVWVDLGLLFFTVELFEGGQYVGRTRGWMPRAHEAEAFVTGPVFAALVRIHPDKDVRCTVSC